MVTTPLAPSRVCLRPLRIGQLQLASNLLLAPIARYCDLGFRLCVRSLGSLGIAYTDLVNPKGLLRRTRKSMELLLDSAQQIANRSSQVLGNAERNALGSRQIADRIGDQRDPFFLSHDQAPLLTTVHP